jgi:Ser/Thr protein kinase RdoA (MazF antagonist)
MEQPAGLAAAVAVGRSFGLSGDQATLLQETNNTVVWLKPDPVIAKVATRPSAESGLRREHALAVQLAEVEAETARPLSGAIPTRHHETGYVVTLWERLDRTRQPGAPPDAVEASLCRLHAALARTTVEVPSFRTWISEAQAAVEDDTFRFALPPHDRDLLRHVFRQGLAALGDLVFDQRRLHGEPHEGNRVVTRAGLRWLDFESCCIGPLEWDLASLPTAVSDRFPEIDTALLKVLARLNSARVATWCGGQARFPEMRRHGEVHLAILRNPSNRQ